ncbi:alpha-mannosidase [Kiritimatiella glycovorans]|uniref:Putative alpha-mannosidase n=1 Tax=Kiritimatiella glycovorans TaxID=1307763 RepID=A0A0G3EFB8_9BACT|nr:glycoside hydrolase family 38 C-terminal domain-containing protein [Kiritimatiella glycovorans]AKJ65146.1 putative alpha-mannosidase [Kiritimatiella glycovorans]
MAAAEPPYDMHLIINTHWDREYRWSFRETQMRLREAGDILVETMENDPRFAYFHADSQASFVDDYLELRPENRERVKKLMAEGRLLAGPWYTLPAEYLVSGEALVRNLLFGHRIAGELGGVMKTAYNIFSWGQVSQLPQIYRQFGMDTILFYRGIDQSNLEKLEFWWEAPDGTKALGLTFGEYHRLNFWVFAYRPYINGGLPALDFKNTTEHGGYLLRRCTPGADDLNHFVRNQPHGEDLDAAMEGMERLIESVRHKSSTRHLLFLQGFDQENPDPIVPDLVDKINERLDCGKLHVSSLPEYVRLAREDIESRGAGESFKTFTGEMLSVEKSGDPFAPLYIGVFSARMPLKMMNAAAQTRLEKWAEPASAWNAWLGGEYPRLFLRKGWQELLQNQQHDGIGGCHVDRISEAMEERYRNVRDIAEVAMRDGLFPVVDRIDFSGLDEKEIGLTVFNPTAQRRSEVVEAVIDVPHEWGLRIDPGTHYVRPMAVKLADADGNPVRAQISHLEDETAFAYLRYGSHMDLDVTRLRIAFHADDLPPMGYASFTVRPEQSQDRPVDLLSPVPRRLENDHLRAEILPDGSLDLFDKASGETYAGLHVFEDEGECGGPLTHDRPESDQTWTTKGLPARIACIENGPVRSRYRIEREWELPEGLDAEIRVHVPHGNRWIYKGPLRRSERKIAMRMVTEVSLRRDARQVEFETTIDHTVRDHRLRVLFPTGRAEATTCRVDSAFDVVTRDFTIPDSSGWYEAAARTLPTTSFVDVEDAKGGLQVMHRGLSEYEVSDDADRAVALTLLRAFGTAGNNSEMYEPQPLAQCPGTHGFRYAVAPHDAGEGEHELANRAMRFVVPPETVSSTRHEGTLPMRHSFLQWDSERFVFSALKQAESGEAMILRGYNPTGEAADVTLTVPDCVTAARMLTLEEKVDAELELEDGRVRFSAGAGAIVTIELTGKGGA